MYSNIAVNFVHYVFACWMVRWKRFSSMIHNRCCNWWWWFVRKLASQITRNTVWCAKMINKMKICPITKPARWHCDGNSPKKIVMPKWRVCEKNWKPMMKVSAIVLTTIRNIDSVSLICIGKFVDDIVVNNYFDSILLSSEHIAHKYVVSNVSTFDWCGNCAYWSKANNLVALILLAQISMWADFSNQVWLFGML